MSAGGFTRRLLVDATGSASTQLLSWAPVWFIVLGVFLMNVQLGRNFIQRDMVDHATSVAADTTMKTLCADAVDYGGVPPGEFTGKRASAVRETIAPILRLVSPETNACRLRVTGNAAPSSAGTRTVDIELSCEFPCEIPIAAQVMCAGTPRHVTFAAKRTTVAMGCDMADGRYP